MRVPTNVREALSSTPSSALPRPQAPDFACVKVRASADCVLTALAAHARVVASAGQAMGPCEPLGPR